MRELLSPLPQVRLGISISQQPSSSNPVADIEEKANGESGNTQIVRRETVSTMREKFKKYWEGYSMILSVAAVLDPRYKLEVIEFSYEKMHDGNRSLIFVVVERDTFTSWANRKKNNIEDKSELDQYLKERRKQWIKGYDILAYWKATDSQFPYMARDILAIPVFIVASKSSFSAGGRVIDKYRSWLLPKNVEVLVCLPDEVSEELYETLSDVILTPPTTSTNTTSAPIHSQVSSSVEEPCEVLTVAN
ncbi:Zinc finger BED domain-containing protein [Drosera capensis]